MARILQPETKKTKGTKVYLFFIQYNNCHTSITLGTLVLKTSPQRSDFDIIVSTLPFKIKEVVKSNSTKNLSCVNKHVHGSL